MKRKIIAIVMAVIMLFNLTAVASFATVTDVDEGHDEGIKITNNFNTNIQYYIVDANAPEEVLFSVSQPSIPYAYGNPITQGYVEEMKNTTIKEWCEENNYTICNEEESTQVFYSSPQVLNTEGDVIIVGDVDDLVEAYIAGGKVSSVLEINKYEVVQIKFEAVKKGENTSLLGDVNNDGNVTIVDAKWVLQSVAELRALTDEQKATADVNGDGEVTIIDAKWILQSVAGTRVL